MKKEIIELEIKKMRKLMKSKKVTEYENDKLWTALLTLQWCQMRKPTKGISPLTIAVPRYNKNWIQLSSGL